MFDIVIVDHNATVRRLAARILENQGLLVSELPTLEQIDSTQVDERTVVFVNLSADPSSVLELGSALPAALRDSSRIVVTAIQPALVESFCIPGELHPFAFLLRRPYTPRQLLELVAAFFPEIEQPSPSEPHEGSHPNAFDMLADRLYGNASDARPAAERSERTPISRSRPSPLRGRDGSDSASRRLSKAHADRGSVEEATQLASEVDFQAEFPTIVPGKFHTLHPSDSALELIARERAHARAASRPVREAPPELSFESSPLEAELPCFDVAVDDSSDQGVAALEKSASELMESVDIELSAERSLDSAIVDVLAREALSAFDDDVIVDDAQLFAEDDAAAELFAPRSTESPDAVWGAESVSVSAAREAPASNFDAFDAFDDLDDDSPDEATAMIAEAEIHQLLEEEGLSLDGSRMRRSRGPELALSSPAAEPDESSTRHRVGALAAALLAEDSESQQSYDGGLLGFEDASPSRLHSSNEQSIRRADASRSPQPFSAEEQSPVAAGRRDSDSELLPVQRLSNERPHLRELPRPEDLSVSLAVKALHEAVGRSAAAQEPLAEQVQELSAEDVLAEKGPNELITFDGEPVLDDVPPPAPQVPAHLTRGLQVTGSVRVWPLTDILMHVLNRANPCVLSLGPSELALSLYIDGSSLVWAEQHDQSAPHGFVDILVDCGILSAENALPYVDFAEAELLSRLIEDTGKSADELLDAMTWHVEQRLEQAAMLNDVDFVLHGQLEPGHISLLERRPRVAVPIASRLFEVYRRQPQAMLQRCTRPGMRYRNSSDFPLFDGLALNEEEKWVLDALLEARSLDGLLEYAADEGYDPDVSRMTFERLLQFGLVTQLMRS